jgi:hypothetical protein
MTSDAKLTQSPDGMSDTPRTDAIEAGFAGWDKLRWIPHVVVQKSLAHARELERECKRLDDAPADPEMQEEVVVSHFARELELDAKRYAARRWKIYHERQRLQVGGIRQTWEEFVKEYNAACDKDVENFEAERREYGPIP